MDQNRNINPFVRQAEDGRFLIAPFGRLGSTYVVDAAIAERLKRVGRRYSYACLIMLFAVLVFVGWGFESRPAKISDRRLNDLIATLVVAIPFYAAITIHCWVIVRGAPKISVAGFPPGISEFMRLLYPRWLLIVMTGLTAAMTVLAVIAIGHVALAKDKPLHLGLIAGIPLLGAVAYLFFRAAVWRKPDQGANDGATS